MYFIPIFFPSLLQKGLLVSDTWIHLHSHKQEELIFKKYEEKLKLVMGTKVNINRKSGGKGKIEIEYYSPDEFERLIEIMSNIN